MKQVQEISLVRVGNELYGVKARVRPQWWPFWSSWGWVLIDFAKPLYTGQGHQYRQKIIAANRQEANSVYLLAIDNGIVPDANTGDFIVIEATTVGVKDVET
jgi:hypothetical protein